MRGKLSFFIAIAIFVVPLILYFLAKTGKPTYRGLPHFGERVEPNGSDIKDTIFYTVPDFNFISQNSKPVTQQTFANSIYVANFFFATCKDVCPKMNAKMETVYKNILEQEFTEVKFLSITVDPENDSVSVLNQYAKKFNASPEKWYFATGTKESVLKAGRGFLLPVSMEDSTVDHSQQLLLIDKENHIRGIYNGLDEVEIVRLNEEIKVLLYEYHKPKQ